MNYKNYNDYELIYMIRESDDDSYYVLFNKYLPIIKSIAYSYYKSYNTFGYELDDFIQEAYISFQRSVSKYNTDKNVLFYTFVIMCIHRSLLSFCEKISNNNKNISSLYLDSIDNIALADGLNSLDDYFVYLSTIKEMWNVVYKRSIEYISVFELRWNHFSFSEISELLDLPIRKTHSIYRRCIIDIQKRVIL